TAVKSGLRRSPLWLRIGRTGALRSARCPPSSTLCAPAILILNTVASASALAAARQADLVIAMSPNDSDSRLNRSPQPLQDARPRVAVRCVLARERGRASWHRRLHRWSCAKLFLVSESLAATCPLRRSTALVVGEWPARVVTHQGCRN